MVEDTFTYLVGGQAGAGVKKAGLVATSLFVDMGRHVFQMDDYMSLIRGGHNFSVVSTSVAPIKSHYMKADLVVCFDQRSYDLHKGHLAKDGLLVHNSDAVKGDLGIGIPMRTLANKYPQPRLRVGVSGIAVLTAVLGLDKDTLRTTIENEYPRDLENNKAFAEDIFEVANREMGPRFTLEKGDRKRATLTGNEAIALGAAAAGLDAYFAYPMTPASSVLHYLARHAEALRVAVVHPENEIAVANMAIGATVAGARVMVGSSGGGFALMEEAFSLAGMAESPLLCVLSSRPGPSTGVPTYTEQGDLRFALNQGHGDLPRFVASPGTVEEAFYLAAEMLGLVWRFQTPGIILTEKHLSESTMTVDIDVDRAKEPEPLMHKGGGYKRYQDTPDGVSPMLFPPSKEPIYWSSYETDELGITTEDGPEIAKKHEKRYRKQKAMVEHLRGVHTVNTFGNDGPIIMTYGSTVMSVLEAIRAGGMTAKVVQPVYLEPFPVWELERYKDGPIIVVEQSISGQFATLLKEKAGLEAKAVIKRYDGRPFEPEELSSELKEAV
jgi:2-oxoglutarate ferredoxin oxidoreductase subunit alpha